MADTAPVRVVRIALGAALEALPAADTVVLAAHIAPGADMADHEAGGTAVRRGPPMAADLGVARTAVVGAAIEAEAGVASAVVDHAAAIAVVPAVAVGVAAAIAAAGVTVVVAAVAEEVTVPAATANTELEMELDHRSSLAT